MNSELLNAVRKTVRGSNITILPGYGKPKIESDYYLEDVDIQPMTIGAENRVIRGLLGLEVTE